MTSSPDPPPVSPPPTSSQIRPQIRHIMSLCLVAIMIPQAIPEILEFVGETIFPTVGGIVEPWYFTGTFWDASLTLLLLEIGRQFLHGRVFVWRLALVATFAVATWANERWWLFPLYEILIVFAGYTFAYGSALLFDLRCVMKGAPPPAPSRRWEAAAWGLSGAFLLLLNQYSIRFPAYIAVSAEIQFALWETAGATVNPEQVEKSHQALERARATLASEATYGAFLTIATITCFALAVTKAATRDRQSDRSN